MSKKTSDRCSVVMAGKYRCTFRASVWIKKQGYCLSHAKEVEKGKKA